MKSKSLAAFIFVSVFIISVSFFYYPRWKQAGTEATISMDASGYYWYLPAIFIYKDIKHLSFSDSVMNKYHPRPEFTNAFKCANGNQVMKYSCGMALQYLPFFLIANFLASPLGFSPNGFSLPYQFAIQFGSILFCLIGLWFLRKILLLYFQDSIVAIILLLFVLCSNYLNYAAIDSAFSHNWLFTWYCLLIFFSHKFYEKQTFQNAAIVGGIVGIMILTRPSEIISVIIPLTWGMSFSTESFNERLKMIKNHFSKYLLGVFICAGIFSIQLFYWKYVSGNWFVYTYQDEGFNWLHPHFLNYALSYRSGWLLYSPLLIFVLIGFLPFVKKKENGVPVLLFTLVNIYVVSSWNTWWFGGRAMVQSYPILAFPLAALIQETDRRKILRYTFYFVFTIICYYNIWWTHQLHRGGLIGQFNMFSMTKEYFWKTVGRFDVPVNAMKLLDTDEEFTGTMKDAKVIYSNDFENDSTAVSEFPIVGKKSLMFNKQNQFSDSFEMPFINGSAKWIRASADFKCNEKEPFYWRMTQFIVRFQENDEIVKERMIRVQRLIKENSAENIFIDVKIPERRFNKVVILFWNSKDQPVWIDDLKVESFNEK